MQRAHRLGKSWSKLCCKPRLNLLAALQRRVMGPFASKGSAPRWEAEGLGKDQGLSWRHLPCFEIVIAS